MTHEEMKQASAVLVSKARETHGEYADKLLQAGEIFYQTVKDEEGLDNPSDAGVALFSVGRLMFNTGDSVESVLPEMRYVTDYGVALIIAADKFFNEES